MADRFPGYFVAGHLFWTLIEFLQPVPLLTVHNSVHEVRSLLSTDPVFEIQHVSFTYEGKQPALEDIDLLGARGRMPGNPGSQWMRKKHAA